MWVGGGPGGGGAFRGSSNERRNNSRKVFSLTRDKQEIRDEGSRNGERCFRLQRGMVSRIVHDWEKADEWLGGDDPDVFPSDRTRDNFLLTALQ